jgi:hypothetical protein
VAPADEVFAEVESALAATTDQPAVEIVAVEVPAGEIIVEKVEVEAPSEEVKGE